MIRNLIADLRSEPGFFSARDQIIRLTDFGDRPLK